MAGTASPNRFVERLSHLDACALSDALDTLGIGGCVTGLTAALPGRSISGRVHTVRLDRVSKEATASAAHLGTAAIEACAPGDVIVIEQRTGIDCACWGGILSRSAKACGVAGVVAEGLVRDVDEARSLGFPLFSRGYTARTARGRVHEVATDEPVHVGDAVVNAGDYCLADSSGAVFVSAGRIEEVLGVAESICAREAAMAALIDRGEPATRVMGANYEQMLSKR